jgi:predicted enzyme related to lactoylglutathione lyase
MPGDEDKTPLLVDPSRLCQIEVHVQDLTRATQFYAEAFGWTAAPAELHQYVVLNVPKDNRFGLSLIPSRTGNAPSTGSASKVVIYFAVGDPEVVVRRAESAGGRKRLGPMQLSGYGEVWQVEDPEGVCWGLYRQTAPSPSLPGA